MKSTSPSDDEEGEAREERSAGFVLFRSNGGTRRYLVLRHREGGHWAFPKGRIEAGEDEPTTARREMAEETGIERLVVVPGFRACSAYRFRRGGRPIQKTVSYWLAETDQRDIHLSCEHDDAAWLGAVEARRRLTYEASRQILDQAEAWLAGACEEDTCSKAQRNSLSDEKR